MTYLVKEVFQTIQGEGYWTGRAAVFVRFSRCNLWTGREEDRATAICRFCDTDFIHGERLDADELVDRIENAGPAAMVVFTGGEPALQLDATLIGELHRSHYLAIETNGTRPLPDGIDWVCVSPKAGTELQVTTGDELKLVYPQQGLTPEMFADLEFDHFWLSPMNDGDQLDPVNAKAAYEYCLTHPRWRLNTQVHKVIGVR